MGADAAIVEAATWTAVVAAACLVVRVRRVAAMAAALVVTAGGASFAASGSDHGSPPAVSADWPAHSRPGHAAPVTVRRGDCLWDIARQQLIHPTTSRVATAWPQWWRTNRRVIGPDPDLVLPGQRLRPPASKWSPS